MKDITNTQFFQVETGPQIQAKDILEIVYNALPGNEGCEDGRADPGT